MKLILGLAVLCLLASAAPARADRLGIVCEITYRIDENLIHHSALCDFSSITYDENGQKLMRLFETREKLYAISPLKASNEFAIYSGTQYYDEKLEAVSQQSALSFKDDSQGLEISCH